MSSPVAATTALSNQQFFGRAYKLTVTAPTASGTSVITVTDSTFEPEALRITFDVRTVFYQVAWFAEIRIYNLDQTTTQQILGAQGQQAQSNVNMANGIITPIKQGFKARLEAGYQNGRYGVIWDGPVYQATFARENTVDFVITLHCLYWLDPLTRTSVSSSFAAFTSQTTIIQKIANLAFGSSQPVTISSNIPQKTLSRGKVVFGTARKYFDDFANEHNTQWFANSAGINMAKIDDNIPTDAKALSFGPPALPQASAVGVQPPADGQGIIVGTPDQTQYGVRFQVLLDPTVVVKYPAQVVNINNSQIVQLKRTIGEYPSILDQSGNYIVVGARYIGDTRGEPWYTEIDGLTSVQGRLAMLQSLAGKASLNQYP